MNTKRFKCGAWMIIVGVFSPLWAWYFSQLLPAALWVYAWLVVWAIFVWTKWDDLTKGLVLIVGSCWVAMDGRVWVAESAPVMDGVQNMMLLIGGGVGGNFIHGYLTKRPVKGK